MAHRCGNARACLKSARPSLDASPGMRIHALTERALRLLIHVAHASGRRGVPVVDAAEFSGLFGTELDLVVAELEAAGYLERRPGFRPSLRLACPPASINLWSLIELFEGPPVPPLEHPSGRNDELLAHLSRTLSWASIEFCNFLAQYSLAQLLPREIATPDPEPEPQREIRRGHLRLVTG
jgi:DNA-binding IscR family transcriptional regulator